MLLIGGQTAVLCGPTGVGRRSLIESAFHVHPELDFIPLNLSRCPSIEFALRTLEQFCIYMKSTTATQLKPKANNSFLVIMCNHLDLPELDKHKTQQVVEFLHQMLKLNGFWDPHCREWIQLEKIYFTSIRSPMNPGRVKLSSKFLGRVTVIEQEHLPQEAVLSIVEALLGEISSDQICSAMVSFYTEFRNHFQANKETHYLASMKDLVAWIKSFTFVMSLDTGVNIGQVLYNEGLRIFAGRLASLEEQSWAVETLKSVVWVAFNEIDLSEVVYSRIGGDYQRIELSVLQGLLEPKLELFSKTNSVGGLVLFDESVAN
jgi:dynein heavy chain 1